MSKSSQSDEERLVEAILRVLGRKVTAIRLKEDPTHRPRSAAEDVLGARLGDVRKALDSLGLRTVRHGIDERPALRRLVAALLDRVPEKSNSENSGPKLFDIVQEAEGEVLAPWLEGPPDVRPQAPRAEAGAGAGEAELWRVQMRQALLGDLDKEEGVRLVRRLRDLSREAHERRQATAAAGERPHQVTAEPETTTGAGKLRDPHLIGAARPITAMINQWVKDVPRALKPLLREIRDRFHESGYKVDDLRQSTQANDWRMRQLQDELGLPAIDLLQELRMELAMRLFRDTPRTVRQVAKAMGYKSARALRRLCGDWCGLPPSRLRNRLKAMGGTLRSLPEEAFTWLFLDRCRRGEVLPETLRPVLEHLEVLYGPIAD